MKNRSNGTRPANVSYGSWKSVKSLLRVWSDTEEEFQSWLTDERRTAKENEAYNSGGGPSLRKWRTLENIKTELIEREVNRCIQADIIQDGGQKIKAILISQDRELSQLGVEIVISLRDQRLGNT